MDDDNFAVDGGVQAVCFHKELIFGVSAAKATCQGLQRRCRIELADFLEVIRQAMSKQM